MHTRLILNGVLKYVLKQRDFHACLKLPHCSWLKRLRGHRINFVYYFMALAQVSSSFAAFEPHVAALANPVT